MNTHEWTRKCHLFHTGVVQITKLHFSSNKQYYPHHSYKKYENQHAKQIKSPGSDEVVLKLFNCNIIQHVSNISYKKVSIGLTSIKIVNIFMCEWWPGVNSKYYFRKHSVDEFSK